MPNRCQRPRLQPGGQPRSASRPAPKPNTMPSRLGTNRPHGGARRPRVAVGLEQAQHFPDDDRRGQHHRQGEAELLHPPPRQAPEQPGGDGGAGPGEAPERQAQPLHRAHPAGARAGPIGAAGRRWPVVLEPGIDDQHAHRRQGGGDQAQVAEQIISISAWGCRSGPPSRSPASGPAPPPRSGRWPRTSSRRNREGLGRSGRSWPARRCQK